MNVYRSDILKAIENQYGTLNCAHARQSLHRRNLM